MSASPVKDSARARLRRLKSGLPRQKIVRRGSGRAPKSSFFARGGSGLTGGALPAGRVTRGFSWIFVIALSMLCARWYLGQKLDLSGQVERVLRAQIAPSLEKQLGEKVEFGAVETDWLGRVVVRDIVVGRNGRLPTGALAQAKSATLQLDLPGLVLRRVAFPDAVRSATLDEPQIYLSRDKNGFNWAKLLSKGGQGAATRWQGRVTATNGRIYFLDATTRGASGQPLILDARGVDATLDTFLSAPYRFTALARSPYLGASARLLPLITSRGALQSDAQNGLFTIETHRAPFAPLADFAFPRREVVPRGTGDNGEVSGRIVFTLQNGKLAQHGALTLQNIALSADALREPTSGREVPIEALSGPFNFAGNSDGTAFSTPKTTFSALGSSFQAAGAVSLAGQSPFDIEVKTPALPVAALHEFLPATTKNFHFSSGATPLKLHLSGNVAGKSRRINASGSLEAPQARFSEVKSGTAAYFPRLRTLFAASATLVSSRNQLADWKFAVRGVVAGAKMTAEQGNFSAQNTLFSVRAARFGGLEIRTRASAFSLGAARYGQSHGQELLFTASAPDALHPTFGGALRVRSVQTGGLRLAAISASLAKAVRSSGNLDCAARFSGLDANFDPQKMRGAASFALDHLQLERRAFAPDNRSVFPLQNTDLSLRALRGQVAFGGGVLQVSHVGAVSSFGDLRLDASVPMRNPGAGRIALSLPTARLDAARFAPFLAPQNVALDGNWHGRVSVLSRAPDRKNGSPQFGLDFDVQSAFATLRGTSNASRHHGANRPGSVLLGAPRLRGRVEFTAGTAPTWNGIGSLEAQETRIQSGNLGRLAVLPTTLAGARAAGVRFDFAAKSHLGRTIDFARDNNFRASRLKALILAAPSRIPRSVTTPFHTVAPRDPAAMGPLPQPAPSREKRSETAPLQILGHLEARSVSAPLPALASASAARRGAFLTLRAVSADINSASGAIQIPRFSARYGAGQVAGTAQIQGGAARLQMLAQGIDIAGAQRVLAPDSVSSVQVSGLGSALIELAPGLAPRAQIRLARGGARLFSDGKWVPLVLNAARADVELPASGAVQVRNATVWSEGARLAGDAALQNGQWGGKIEVSGVRLARFAAFAPPRGLADAAQADGLLGGAFSFRVDPRHWSSGQLEGRASLQLAQVFGAQIDAARARLSLRNSARGLRLEVADFSGKIEDAPVAGALNADFVRNTWNASLTASGLESGRLTRLRALQTATGSEPREAILARALPLAGDLSAQIELSGSLMGAHGVLAPRARNGFARFASGPLAWRGKPVGALHADLQVVNGVARAKTLELSRPANGDADGATSLVQISGNLPLDARTPGLDAQIRVASSPLSFFTQALQEGRDTLRNSHLSVPFFERAVAYVDALPNGTTGQVALDATLSGTWSAPRVQVSNLTLRDARTRVPAGGLSPPATLDAAFSLEKGAVTIEKAEFKIRKSVQKTVDSEDEDTLLRVEPGGSAVPDGPISLAADIFNANLSQLSPWVPALRTSEGAPLLRGDLSEFSLRVGGTTIDPIVTGSVQGENLMLDKYSLDRLRVSRFEIGGGSARIEPGNLTVVKGAFQSSAAYGRVPWSWNHPGPVMDGPLDVHFPVQTRDFGALVGTFVPALTVADADEFNGSIDVAGTLQAPSLSGAITIRGGQFRLDALKSPLAAGLREVSGTVRFVGGTQLLIDAADPLRGKLVSASDVVGRTARGTGTLTNETGRVDTVRGAVGDGDNKKMRSASAAAKRQASALAEPKLAGNFVLRGGIERPAQIDALLGSAAALSRLKYDLSFALDGGAYAAPGFAGISDVSAGLVWKSSAGDAQNVRWMIAARGQKNSQSARKIKNSGTLTSFGSLALRRDFGIGIESLARSSARDFSGEADFAGLAVTKRIDISKFPDRRAQVNFDGFASGLTGAGSGVVDGRLVLDNGARQQKAPDAALRLQNASLRVKSRRSLLGPQFETDFTPLARTFAVESANDALNVEDDSELSGTVEEGAPLRLGGVLTLSNAEIYGAPAGSDGAALLLSRLPSAPRFDIRVKMGRDVQIVTAAFRAGLDGEMVASGSPSAPQILGVLTTRDGQVRFPNARARVDEGRVTVSLTRDPETDGLRTRVEIDATARGQAGRYAITLRLRGPLDLSGSNGAQNLQIDVSSNPPLSQSEAFEQLLGTVPNVEEDGSVKQGSMNRAYASAVLNVLSAPLFSGVEQTLAQTLGLSSVGFDYRFNEPLAVQFTKAIGDRVIISYRRSLGTGPASSLASSQSNGRTPFELRLDYRLHGSYQLGLQTDERQIPSITLQKTRRF